MTEKSIIKKVEKFNKKEILSKDIKESIRVEMGALKQLFEQFDTTTLEKTIERFEMCSNRIKFYIWEIKHENN